MGASSYIEKRDGTKKFSEIKKEFLADIKEAIVEYGTDSYSGTIGTLTGIKESPKTFTDEEAAEDYLLEKAEKWDKAIAVKCNGSWIIGAWLAS